MAELARTRSEDVPAAPAEWKPGEQIVALQVLRAVAATSVVAYHFQVFLGRATVGQIGLPDLTVGTAGVDLFFVISGFVIVYASERLFGTIRGPAQFIALRLIRVVPLYWLITTAYVLIGLAFPSMGDIYSPLYVAASYLFFPMARPDGDIGPVVSQGWTLNFEMLFYVIFTGAVLLTRLGAVVLASLVLVALIVSGLVFSPTRPPLVFWSSSITLEFVFGMFLALAYRERWRVPAWVGVAVIAVGLALLMRPVSDDTARVLRFGIPVALILIGCVFSQFSWQARPWRFVALIGDASYGMYLTHLLPILAVLYLVRKAGLSGNDAPWLFLAVTVACAIAIAIALHFVFERPATQALRRLTQLSTSKPAFKRLSVKS